MQRGLPAHPASVGRARRLVRDQLRLTGREDLVETAELVVSELVTNAIVHAGSKVGLDISVDESGVRVAVSDNSTHLPTLSSYGAMASTGRGLQLVAQMVDAWGMDRRPDGKAIWCRIQSAMTASDEHRSSPAATEGIAAHDGGRRARRSSAVDVMLHNVPLLVHGAWQQHAKALLREYLLIGLDDDVVDRIEAHAAATDALAILEEQIAIPQLSDEPAELMAQAVEPLATSDQLTVQVPQPSVVHFEALDRQLEEAMAEAAAGRLLAPPTQPELVAFRRWLCAEVRRQVGGAEPTPWTSPENAAQPFAPLPPSRWDPREVDESARAVIAADDTGQIIAVSTPAARLLKYDDRRGLVGSRLLEVIPSRYHQAHLAGFTLHQITGRRPLLERPVVVPAQCCDGTEIEVALHITKTPVLGGGTVFLADLTGPE